MSLNLLAPNLWIANQPLRFLGLRVGTRMTIIRLRDRSLVVISPIDLTPDLITEIDALGPVAYQIAPNRYHHLFAQAFQQHYPHAQFWAAIGLQEKRPDLAIAHTISADQGSLDPDLDYYQFPGLNVPGSSNNNLAQPDPLNEIVFLHKPSRTLIITDIAFHFDHTSPWEIRLLSRLLGGYNTLQPTRLEQWVSDRPRVEQSIHQLLTLDFDRVIMAHGSIIETNGKAMLKEGYEWFLGKSLQVTT